jgi:hypothetical protein
MNGIAMEMPDSVHFLEVLKERSCLIVEQFPKFGCRFPPIHADLQTLLIGRRILLQSDPAASRRADFIEGESR